MIRHENIAVGTAVESVWTGGEGTPLLLLHGAWGGAQMHWSTVWDALTERCRVIAPDFPGLASESSSIPRLGLPGSTVKTGQRIQASLPDARLTVIPDAGHLPQIEQPDRFVHAVLNFAHTEVGGFGK